MPTAEQVADKARAYAENSTYWGPNYCLKFARTCAAAPGIALDAITAWRAAQHRHNTGVPPRGALVWWSGGSRSHGHVAVSDGPGPDGRGYVWSTDIVRSGRVDRVSIARLGATWHNLTYLGWSADVNGITVSGIATTPVDPVNLVNLRPGSRHSDVTQYQAALIRAGLGKLIPAGATGLFAEQTRAATRAFQEKQGWSGADADGIPGPRTVALLGLHAA